MFDFIINPQTKKKYSIASRKGQKLLSNFLIQLKGGTSQNSIQKNLDSLFKETEEDQKKQKDNKTETDSKIFISEKEFTDKVKELDKKIREAQNKDDKKDLLKTLKEKNQFIQDYMITPLVKEKPRLDCNNELCDIGGKNEKETGLRDLITGDCYRPNDLIRLSDGFCYYNREGVGINKVMKSSPYPVRNLNGLNYNLDDYIKILNFYDGSKIYKIVTVNKLIENIDFANYYLETARQSGETNEENLSHLRNNLDSAILEYKKYLKKCFPDLISALYTMNFFKISYDESEESVFISQLMTDEKDNYYALKQLFRKLERNDSGDIISNLLSELPSYENLQNINDDFLWNKDTIIMNRNRPKNLFSPRGSISRVDS